MPTRRYTVLLTDPCPERPNKLKPCAVQAYLRLYIHTERSNKYGMLLLLLFDASEDQKTEDMWNSRAFHLHMMHVFSTRTLHHYRHSILHSRRQGPRSITFSASTPSDQDVGFDGNGWISLAQQSCFLNLLCHGMRWRISCCKTARPHISNSA